MEMDRSLEHYLAYRHEGVMKAYQQEYNSSDMETEALFVEMLKFLYVCAHKTHSTPYTPSTLVDDMWHIFLEYSADYDHFCMNFLGKNIEHNEGHSHIDFYLAAKNDISNLFGTVSSAYWLGVKDEGFRLADCCD